jgi:peptidylprolyl isomerase
MEKERAGIGKTVIVGIVILMIIIAGLVYVALSPRPLVHDVAIAGVVPDSVAVPQGLNIKVNVTVKNQGSFQETFNVSIALPKNSSVQTLQQKVANLSAGAEKKLTFDWNTANLSIGDYRINMTASPVVNETDLVDNSLSTVLSLSNKVMLRTSMGNVTIELFQDMPITSKNFKNLTWIRIYDGTIFHRVIDKFMIQGGDPTGTGYGDPKIASIPDEFTDHNWNNRGTIAMANAGPNTGSSQFFINLVNNNSLDDKHPVFGRVIAGMSVVDAIGKVPTYTEQEGQKDKPKQDVKIIKAEFVK